jgi:hypothetical protein
MADAAAPPAFEWIFGLIGIADNTAISNVEVDAYVALMKPCDGGKAFLKIIRGFERTRAKQNFFYQGLRSRPYPAQVVWGQRDRMLGDDRRRAVQDALTVDTARAAARAPFPSGRPSPRRRDSARQRGAPIVIHRSSDAARRSLKTVETTPIKVSLSSVYLKGKHGSGGQRHVEAGVPCGRHRRPQKRHR